MPSLTTCPAGQFFDPVACRCCTGYRGTCATDAECCLVGPNSCFGGQCNACQGEGTPCAVGGVCCSGEGVGGTCACHPLGTACDVTEQCCGFLSGGVVCAGGRCVNRGS